MIIPDFYIKVFRGGSKNPLKLKSGEVYDSAIEIFDTDGKWLKRFEHVNTDPAPSQKGGIITAGVYYSIIDDHEGTSGKKPYLAHILFIVDNDERYIAIKQKSDLRESERTFPSKVPNPSQGGAMKMKYINIHMDGQNGNSKGCLTLPPEDWPGFISYFERGQKGIVEIIEPEKNVTRRKTA
jgi:hypothetical protein